MNEATPDPTPAARRGRTTRRRVMAGAGFAALAAAALATQRHAFAQPMGGPRGPGGPGGPGMDFGMGFGGMGFGPMGFGGPGETDPAVAARRLDAMVAFRLADIDATPEQRARISAIVQSLVKDLFGTRAKMGELRRQSIALLGAAKTDRAALEKLRAEQMEIADTSSKRLLQALADGADVLTPEQRAKLMERHQRHMQGPDGRGPRDGQPGQPGQRGRSGSPQEPTK